MSDAPITAAIVRFLLFVATVSIIDVFVPGWVAPFVFGGYLLFALYRWERRRSLPK